jgi:hypothetical protein
LRQTTSLGCLRNRIRRASKIAVVADRICESLDAFLTFIHWVFPDRGYAGEKIASDAQRPAGPAKKATKSAKRGKAPPDPDAVVGLH